MFILIQCVFLQISRLIVQLEVQKVYHQCINTPERLERLKADEVIHMLIEKIKLIENTPIAKFQYQNGFDLLILSFYPIGSNSLCVKKI